MILPVNYDLRLNDKIEIKIGDETIVRRISSIHHVCVVTQFDDGNFQMKEGHTEIELI